MNEFDIIRKYFAPLCPHGIDNDAAVLQVPEGHELVVTSDTLNEGIHFFEKADPDYIAHKALRVNLSDLASMGAKPLAYQLNVAFPHPPQEGWLESFTKALLKDQNEFGIICSGGDTTSIKGSLSVSITAMGTVPKGKALTRSGARDGDMVVLSGPVGDAYMGYKNPDDEIFLRRYYMPIPRLDLRDAVQKYARAAIDVSDGLVADLDHICRASGVGAQIELPRVPFSEQAQTCIDQGRAATEDLITGGDDYELALAINPKNLDAFLQAAPDCIQIGTFSTGDPAVTVLDKDGAPVDIKHTGWSHF